MRLQSRRAATLGGVDELEPATLSWVHWFNNDRLHGHCGDVPPAEFEAAFSAGQHPDRLIGAGAAAI